MTPVLLRLRADLRGRWRSWLVLVLVIAIGGGAVLALLAGARRTESAFPRFLARTNAADVIMYLPQSALDLDTLRSIPEVTDVAAVTGLQLSDSVMVPGALTDPRYGRDVNKFQILEGRALDPTAPREAVVGFVLAQRMHLHPGSHITLNVPSPVDFDVVGVEASAGEFPPRSRSANLPLWVSPAFLDTPEGRAALAPDQYEALAVRLRPGTSVDDFSAEVQQRASSFVSISDLGDQRREQERSAHAQATVLRLAAAIAAVALGLVLLQLLLRDAADGGAEHEVLRSIGFTRGQRRAVHLLRCLATAIVGAAGAVGVAVALSQLFPLGVLGQAELQPGVTLDATVLIPGMVAVVAVAVALGTIAATRRSGRARHQPPAGPSVSEAVTHLSLPHVAETGARLALDPGRGPRALPVRATLVATALAITSIAAALTTAASLHHLLATPALYGVTYDAHLESTTTDDVAAATQQARSDPDVARVVVASTGIPMQSGDVSFGGESVVGDPESLAPTVLDGRLPSAADEIALGTRTLSDLHAHIGDTIPAAVTGVTSAMPFHVVGRVVMAPLSDTQQLGRGAVITAGALDAFIATAPAGFSAPPPGDAFVTFRDGVDPAAAVDRLRATLAAAADGQPPAAAITLADSPADIDTFAEVKDLPSLLAILLGTVAALTIGHLLVSSVRRRREELATLKALGYTPRQLASAIAWQASIVMVVALIVGIPLGMAAGRSLWMLLGSWASVVARPTVPVPWLVALVPATLLFANVVALAPALTAAKTRTVRVLRAE